MHNIGMKALAATLLAGVAAPALAADPVDPVVEVIDQTAVIGGGWYLRGHIGMSNQRIDGLESDLYAFPDAHGFLDEGGFGSAPTFGVGLGYQFNDFLRGDLTVEYRGAADFTALDWQNNGGTITTNDYSARKSEWLLLANAYADLGTFYGVTPYVGAGIGASRNTISGFRDVNVITGGAAYAADTSRWDFAWALHAGLGIKATERMTIDLGYSYVSLGDGQTGELKNDSPTFPFPPPGNDGITFKDIASHDFKLGVRYSLY